VGIPHPDGGVKTKNTKEEKMGITLPCPDGRVKSRSHEYLYDPMVLSGVDKLASILNNSAMSLILHSRLEVLRSGRGH